VHVARGWVGVRVRMALSIQTNIASLRTQRALANTQSDMAAVMERLASGKRINSARDDAAGLAIASRLTAQVNGFNVAMRNASDGQAMLQTSDGALSAITENLQRMRELALQATNGTLGAGDREAIQLEVEQLKNEIDRVAKQTKYNGINLLDRDAVYSAADFEPGTSFERIDFSALEGEELVQAQKQVIVDQLRNRWLREAERMVEEAYGITGDGAEITIFIDEEPEPGTEGFAAYVRSSIDPTTGLGQNIELHLNLDSFLPVNPPTTGLDPDTSPTQFNAFGLADRTIVHEMVHAVARRSINTGTSRWFEEGLGDLIHGGDERVASYLFAAGQAGDASVDVPLPNIAGNNVTNRDALADEIGDGTGGADAWNTAGEYTASYVAVRYLDQAIRDSGGNGVRDVIDKLKADPTSVTVDDAIQQVAADLGGTLQVSGYAASFNDEASFLTAFRTDGDAGGGGSQFIRDRIDIMNADTGSIFGIDADPTGGTLLSAETVVPDENAWEAQPLDNWTVVFPEGFEPPEPSLRLGTETASMALQIGPYAGDTLTVELGGANLNALRLESVDVSGGDDSVLELIDRAMDHVSVERGLLGATMNRLQSIVDTSAIMVTNLSAARSRIEDADYAAEATELARLQVLQQAGVAVLAQANAAPQLALQLLQ
jgi:flagellin